MFVGCIIVEQCVSLIKHLNFVESIVGNLSTVVAKHEKKVKSSRAGWDCENGAAILLSIRHIYKHYDDFETAL